MPRLLLLVLLAALCVPATASAAKRPPKVPADWVGVHADGPLTHGERSRGREWDRMKRARVGFVRAAFFWREVQPSPETLDWTRTDAVVAAAARRGLTVLPVVVGAPAWAAEDPSTLSSPPKDPAQYAALLQALVARYGPGGSFWTASPYLPQRAIREWQVWNEPNIEAYWSEQPFQKGYVALLEAARAALKRADPGAKVVLAGLPNTSWVALRRIYAAGGEGLFDSVALHPYTGKVRNIVRVVRYARKEMRKAGEPRKPVWLTEISWPASQPVTKARPGGFEVTEKGQAKRLRDTLVALARVRKKLRIAHVVWYTWLSAEGRSQPTWSGYSGLRRVTLKGRTKSAPSLKAFKRTVRHLRR